MQAKVAKQFTFHAAHVLPHHDGQCQRLHGHTYVLEVAVIGPVKEGNGDPDEGMVMDFSVLKDIYKMEIEPLVEHQNLNVTLAREDLEVPYEYKTRVGTMPNLTWVPLTTCECLASWMHTVIVKRLRDVKAGLQVKVKLWETPTSFAVVGS